MQTDIAQILPVRGNDAIEILKNDHQVIKNLLNELVSSTGNEARMSTLERLKGVLTVHNATEENLVYPAIREVARKKSESTKLYNETAEADVAVFQLDTALKEGMYDEVPKMAEKLRDAILEHIEDEEEKALPHLQDGAEPAQAQMLTQEVRKFRGMLHMKMAPAGSTKGEL